MLPKIEIIAIILYACFGIGYARPGFMTLSGVWTFQEIISSILATIPVAIAWPGLLVMQVGTYCRLKLNR